MTPARSRLFTAVVVSGIALGTAACSSSATGAPPDEEAGAGATCVSGCPRADSESSDDGEDAAGLGSVDGGFASHDASHDGPYEDGGWPPTK